MKIRVKATTFGRTGLEFGGFGLWAGRRTDHYEYASLGGKSLPCTVIEADAGTVPGCRDYGIGSARISVLEIEIPDAFSSLPCKIAT